MIEESDVDHEVRGGLCDNDLRYRELLNAGDRGGILEEIFAEFSMLPKIVVFFYPQNPIKRPKKTAVTASRQNKIRFATAT